MITEEKVQELVHQYLEGGLTQTEREDFDRRLKEDEEFAQQVNDYRILIEGLNALGAEHFTNKVAQWEKKYSVENTEKTAKVVSMTPLRKYFAAAAVILILLMPVGYWYVNQTSSFSNDELYAQNFEPYPDLLTDRGTGDKLRMGMAFYSQKDYKNAILLLNEYASEIPADSSKNEHVLYLGIAYLENGEIDNAIGQFNLAIQYEKYNRLGTWYKTLALLKGEKTDEAKVLLQEIIKNDSYRKEKATDLLKSIQ